MGKLSRTKGKVFEQFVAKALREIYGDGVKRGWQAREGDDAPDIEGTPFWVECKHHKKVSVRAAVAQVADAQYGAKRKELPLSEAPMLLVVKDNNEPPLAVMHFADFIELLAERERMLKETTDLRREMNNMRRELDALLEAAVNES
jgi:hypothetical protein